MSSQISNVFNYTVCVLKLLQITKKLSFLDLLRLTPILNNVKLIIQM